MMDHTLVGGSRPATQAAIRAGYNRKTPSSAPQRDGLYREHPGCSAVLQNPRKPEIQIALQELIAAHSQRTKRTGEWRGVTPLASVYWQK
jgi:hypothetical protein